MKAARTSDSRWLLLVLLNSGFIQAGVYVVRPMITYRAVDLGADAALVGLVGSAFALAPLLFAIVMGKWVDKGRDGCRVPLPWTSAGPSFGFGTGSAHLPQPNWFAAQSVEVLSGVATSPLEIFRKALKLRKSLIAPEELTWHPTADANVLHFSRPNGWHCITNFGRNHYNFSGVGEILHSSGPLAPAGIFLVHGVMTTGNDLPPATTVWLKAD